MSDSTSLVERLERLARLDATLAWRDADPAEVITHRPQHGMRVRAIGAHRMC